jgi:diguanylate cyclase (GGDEF)-like protein
MCPSGFGGVSQAAAAGAFGPVRTVCEAAVASPVRPLSEPIDIASFLSIPESELTPKVRAALSQPMAEVQRLRDELERAKKRLNQLEALADRDALTSVLNRRAFVRELSRMMAFTVRYKTPSSVLYFDVNGMKQINDSLGHAAGDAALNYLAGVLVRNVRASDVVGRLGGDEFAVALVQTGREGALEKAESLTAAVQSQPAIWNGAVLEVRVAYGIHTFAGKEPVDEALHAADQAMYQHKNAILAASAVG